MHIYIISCMCSSYTILKCHGLNGVNVISADPDNEFGLDAASTWIIACVEFSGRQLSQGDQHLVSHEAGTVVLMS